MSDRSWNELVTEEFRAHGGRLRWSSESEVASGRPIPTGLPGFEHPGVILVHHVGARSGEPRLNPLWFRPVGDGFAIFGTNNGAAKHPAWYHNLMVHPDTVIETGTATVVVRAREATGAERDRIWRAELDDVPIFAEIERRCDRSIPVVLLEPTPPPAG